MFTTSKRKEELLKLKKENEKLRERNYELEKELHSARNIISAMATNINYDVPKEYYGPFIKSMVLYHMLAIDNNDVNSIKRFFPWVLAKDEI